LIVIAFRLLHEGPYQPPLLELIVNVAGAEIPEAVVTVMLAVPTLAIKLAGTLAVNCVALTNVVVSPVVPHCTVAVVVKFAPFTVNVNPGPPAVAELGLKLLIVGGGSFVPVKSTMNVSIRVAHENAVSEPSVPSQGLENSAHKPSLEIWAKLWP
jgi:hypothetical protein